MKRCSRHLTREIYIKTTISYHLTPLRMAITKKKRYDKFWQGWKEKWTCYVTYSWERKSIQLLWKSRWRFLKKIKRCTQWCSNPISGYTPKGNKSRFLKRYMHSHVNWPLFTTPKVEKQLSLSGWMDKDYVKKM